MIGRQRGVVLVQGKFVVAAVDGEAAREQGVCERRAAVIGQRAELRVDRPVIKVIVRIIAADIVAVVIRRDHSRVVQERVGVITNQTVFKNLGSGVEIGRSILIRRGVSCDDRVVNPHFFAEGHDTAAVHRLVVDNGAIDDVKSTAADSIDAAAVTVGGVA